ncbi:MAG: hypothetical protein NW237_02975 [Cyanobacteriota bacterium]|nr:hypothetical protein [Cyanobacteriota bacterium]
MFRLRLALLAYPTLVFFWFCSASLSHAIEQQTPLSLDVTLERWDPLPSSVATDHPFLEFSEEESNTAIAWFGCDCPAHLNQVRRLRGLPLLQDSGSFSLTR